MVNVTTMMVAVTAMVLGINALDKQSADKLKNELTDAKIIPDAFKNIDPLTEIKITYNDKEVKNGDKVLPSEAVDHPSVKFTAPKKDAFYTLVMMDLDTPAPHVRHWITTNIKGADAENAINDQTKLQEYVPYKGPTPPGSGLHRYVFALYEQSKENQTMTPKLADPTNKRAFFDVNKFAEENKLKLVAASYMKSEHQDGYDAHYNVHDKRNRHVRRDVIANAEDEALANTYEKQQLFNFLGGFLPSATTTSQKTNGGSLGGSIGGALGSLLGPIGSSIGSQIGGAVPIIGDGLIGGIPASAVGLNGGGSIASNIGSTVGGLLLGNTGAQIGESLGELVPIVGGRNGAGGSVSGGASGSASSSGSIGGNGGISVGLGGSGGANGGVSGNLGGSLGSGGVTVGLGNTGTTIGIVTPGTGVNSGVNGGIGGSIGGSLGNGGITVGLGGNTGGLGGSGGISVGLGGNTGLGINGGIGGSLGSGGVNGGINGGLGGSIGLGNGGITIGFGGNGGSASIGGSLGSGGNVGGNVGGSVGGNLGGSVSGSGSGSASSSWSSSSGSSGNYVVGGQVKPTSVPVVYQPSLVPTVSTAYTTRVYTINGVKYEPGQTYRGADGKLYRIPYPTNGPKLLRRDENVEEEMPEEEVAGMEANGYSETSRSGFDTDDLKLFSGLQNAIKAMDEAADELNELVDEVYMNE